jgi:elongation factor G
VHRRRNIGILAHIDAGKTTVTEHLLHLGGLIRRPGSVDSGTTVTDWMVEEQQRGITITSAASTFRWRDCDVTLVDTPGHVDFTIEVERTLRVLDGVVLVISGPDGVQAQTETVWMQKVGAGLPAICFVNKLDGADFDIDTLLAQIADRLHVIPVPLQIASRNDDGWSVIDVFEGVDATNPRWEWGPDGPYHGISISEESRDELGEVARLEALDRLIDAIASSDDSYAELVLAEREPTRDQHHSALRKAVANRTVLPVLFGAARHGLGLAALANAIIDLLPAAADRQIDAFPVPATGIGDVHLASHSITLDGPSCVYVFKTEPRRGGLRLAFVRVFGGAVRTGDVLIRTPDQTVFSPRQLVRVIGRDFDEVARFEQGEIGALLFGPEDLFPRTGDTLGLQTLPFTIERLHPPEPVLEIAVEAPDSDAHTQMLKAFADMCEDDPSLRLGTDRDSGRALLAGMGELHLEIAIERAQRDLGFKLLTGQPQVRRRFILSTAAIGEAIVNHPAGRARARITVAVTPHPTLEIAPIVLERPDWGGAVVSGLEAAVGIDGTGPHPLLNGHVSVSEIDLHGTDIVPIMLRDAAEWAALRALALGELIPAEPWVRLEVIAPDAAIGRLVGDLARRRARVKGSESRGAAQILTAEVPLSELIGFASDLRSMTGGRGQFSLVPLGHRAVDV